MKARLQILLAALLWSTAGAAIKRCALDGWQIAGGRSLVAGLFLLLAVPATRRRPTRTVFLVSVAYAFTVVLFVNATKLTTAANAIFIQDIAPLWVLLLSPLVLGERPTRGELLSVPVYAVGLSMFFLDELSGGQLTGNLVALASGVAFAFTIVGLRKLREDGPASLAWGNLLAAAMALPFGAGPSPTGLDLALVGYLGVFQLGVSYLVFTRGISATPAVEGALLVLLEPILNPVWTYLATGERPGPWALLGGAIVLAATAWRTIAPALGLRRKAAALSAAPAPGTAPGRAPPPP